MNEKYQIQMPPEFFEMTPEQIKFLCELDTWAARRWPFPQWNSLNEGAKRYYHLKAWWTLKGVSDPGLSAVAQDLAEDHAACQDEEWKAECRARGWHTWNPRTYREVEEKFLPKPAPNIRLIFARCPQMAMLHALAGDVSEPYWWAGLSVTEHAEPNLSKECSDGYVGYSDAELEYRRERIKLEGSKPARCERLNGVNPDVCDTCRFNGVVNSPIALGYEHEPKGGRDE